MKIYTVMVEVLSRMGYNKYNWEISPYSGRIHTTQKAAQEELQEAEDVAMHSRNIVGAFIKEEVIEL